MTTETYTTIDYDPEAGGPFTVRLIEAEVAYDGDHTLTVLDTASAHTRKHAELISEAMLRRAERESFFGPPPDAAEFARMGY